MFDMSSIKLAWALLDGRERRSAFKLLAIVIIAALASAIMVGSVLPFLTLLADPSIIEKNPVFSWAYRVGGFSTDYQFLMAMGIATCLVILVMNAILFLNIWAMARWSQMRMYALSRRLLAHYLAQPYEFFLDEHSGDMSTNVLAEANMVVSQVMTPVAQLISAFCTTFAILALLLYINPTVTVAAVSVIGGIYLLLAFTTRRKVGMMGERRAHSNKLRYRLSMESLSGIKDIKLLRREARYLDRFSVPSLEMAQYQVQVVTISNAPQYVLQVVAFCGIILLSLILVDPGNLRDRAALGEFLPMLGVLAFAGQRLLPQLHSVYGAVTTLTFGKAAIERVYGDLSRGRKAEIDRSDPSTISLKKSIEFENVGYTYPNAAVPGVFDLNVKIKSGERIGIVGSSGAGKTTFADIVLGLLHPNTGQLTVDNQPITLDNLRGWQGSVGYVPQDIFLIDSSLAENIALGLSESEIDMKKVEECARIAQLHEFIMNELPDGYMSTIGERGVRLSGGQRQRIGIARALYNEADLIVFDEATSALANLTEREVMTSIEALPGDKTILMIAHRLSTVKICDRLIVMDKGTITGVGAWNELIEFNSAFRRIAEGG